MTKILLVEDDKNIAITISYYLQQEGFTINTAKTVKEGIEKIKNNEYDLMLLDINLPDGTGYALYQEMKNIQEIPTIFLTALDEEKDIVKGFDLGADDYITKPFHAGELLSRIKNVLRHNIKNAKKELEKINWLIKTVLNIAKLDSKTLILAKNNENAYNLCLEVKNNFKAMCEINHANIEIVSNKEETINCDKKWTIEAMNNIVKNAIEHGAKNITIKIEENTIYTKIIIRDNGEGIDKEDLGHIFDRFYKAKNSKESSLGIGLAFCKSIIRNQDGDIRVKSSKKEKDTWTEFTIKLYN